jgi:diguanylate cyclase (GGDEF)-like protein
MPRPRRVLVVDTSETVVHDVVAELRHRGWVVDAASAASEARPFVETRSYDVVVLDGELPGLAGLMATLRGFGRPSTLMVLVDRPARVDERRRPSSSKGIVDLVATEIQGRPDTASDIRVLMVEDSRMDASFTKALLARSKGGTFVSTQVETLAAAEAALALGGHDVVLLDLTLPDGDGLQGVGRVAAHGVPVVVLTGTDDDGLALAALHQGAQDYLLKGTLNPRTLGRTLRHAVERSATLRQLEAANTRLRRLSTLDPLTGVMNRRGFEVPLAEALDRARAHSLPITALLVDVDDFKRLNDNHGYSIGDRFLRQAAQVMETSVREEDRVVRIGGDVFVVLLPDVGRSQGTETAERIRSRLARIKVEVSTHLVHATCSVGVLEVRDERNLDEILHHAYDAVRRSKVMGKNRVSAYGVDTASLDSAEGRGSLSVHAVHQPIFAPDSGDLLGSEYLIRGRVGPLSLPGDLHQLCLDEKRLGYVDMMCFSTCARTAAQRQERKMQHVNLFPSTLLTVPAARVIDTLSRYADPSSWCVELSEELFVGELTDLRRRVSALQAAGIRVAVDDVGCGRSSLEALLVLQPDVIKIDRSYVTGAVNSADATLRLRRLVAICRALDAHTIAEGVESADDLQLVRDLGLDGAQGYYWGIPGEPPIG